MNELFIGLNKKHPQFLWKDFLPNDRSNSQAFLQTIPPQYINPYNMFLTP